MSRHLTHRLFCAPPEEVAAGVWLLRGGLTRAMNVYLLRDEQTGKVVVFDAGEKAMAPAILAAAAERSGISRVVLGHADTDHRGAAPALRAHAQICCHPDAVTQAQGSGGRDYWRMEDLPRSVRLLHGFMHRFVWDGGPVHIDATVREGDTVAGFDVIDLPGHAPGLIGLWREHDRLALVSDCIYLTDMHGKPQPAAVPVDAYNLDTAQARQSVAKLAALNPRTVLAGHLGPLTGADVAAQLQAAAAT
jgi:glyoxylase-like metal-dependent hydrolase (beta-lactamase superfamily II)